LSTLFVRRPLRLAGSLPRLQEQSRLVYSSRHRKAIRILYTASFMTAGGRGESYLAQQYLDDYRRDNEHYYFINIHWHLLSEIFPLTRLMDFS
jgi:hypothetical protein